MLTRTPVASVGIVPGLDKAPCCPRFPDCPHPPALLPTSQSKFGDYLNSASSGKYRKEAELMTEYVPPRGLLFFPYPVGGITEELI